MLLSLIELVAVLLGVGLLVIFGTALLIAQSLLRPPRMTDGKAVYVLQRLSPGDLGLEFSVVHFDVPDESTTHRGTIRIAGWWIPHSSNGSKCVMLIHGYADAKVGSIAWAPVWAALGYHILAIDLRAHGESGGRDCTAGFFERHDMNAVLNQITAQHPEQTRELVLFGISLGGAVALATAAQREDVAAVILDSPFGNYRHAVRSHVRWVGLPTGPTLSLAMRLAELISGARFDSVRPLDMVQQARCPVLMIRGAEERLIPPSDLAAMEAAVRIHGEIWIVPEAGHLEAMQLDPMAYSHRIERFLESMALRTATN